MIISNALRHESMPRSAADPAIPRLVADEHGVLLYANPAFDALCGAPNGAQNKNLIDLLHFDDPDGAFRGVAITDDPVLKNLQNGLHGVYFEQSGMTAALQFDWITLPDARRVLVASCDAEVPPEELIKSWLQPSPKSAQPVHQIFTQDMFQSLSRDAMIVFDDRGTLIDANIVLGKWLEDADVQGRSFIDLIKTEDRAGVRAVLNDLMRGPIERRAITFDCRMASPGKDIWVEWTCRAADECYYAMGRDITTFKRGQLDLARQQEQLLEAEAIGRIGHWYWKLGQDDIEFSEEMYRIFGMTEPEFSPTLYIVDKVVHRRDMGRMMRAFQRAIIEQNDHDIDFRIKRKDGSYCHVRCRGRCKLDNDGDVIALFGIMQDISDRIEQENDLRKAKEEAEHAYATKSQFLANMSHELRTPLNAIIGFSEILERQLFGPLGNQKYVGYTKGIRESGEHLLDLITDILDMSKIEAGQYKLSVEKISMEKILHTAIHMMEGRALENRIKISLSMDKDPRPVIADKRAIMQIMLNVLSNAVKFSHENGKVQIQYLERPDYFSLRVSDEGIGIPANKLPYIGKPFEQVSNQYNRSHEGSGLGLAISKELIHLHGGTLHIDSTHGKGTSVTIKLPYSSAV